MNQPPKTWQIILALLSVYLIWGSTYLAIKVAVGEHDFPPLLMGGIRHLTAGGILFAFLKMRGEASPKRAEWIGASVMGFFLLLGGNGGVVIAESDPQIGSGLAALVIATMPLWAALFSMFFGQPLRWREWLGLLIGFSGIILLNLNGNLNWSTGAVALIIAAMSWAFGSTISRKLTLPKGFMASAAQMIMGGVIMTTVNYFVGSPMTRAPRWEAILALAYLILFGSVIAYSGYIFLLKNVRPALATSYAYANPMVAVLLGWLFIGESITPMMIVAMAVILIGVGIVVTAKK
ncbi:MAG: drug/metabolite exporter YedA [Chloroflexi bacterium]|nr:drug/metabolite exporter YedA [Chloroflexota bacterium]MBI5348754.1 drug/metabolite exporter YedA [Chloroflexota bacterium]